MQEVNLKKESASVYEQRALMWLLKKTIQHDLANDIADTVDGDVLDGKSLNEILSLTELPNKSFLQIKKGTLQKKTGLMGRPRRDTPVTSANSSPMFSRDKVDKKPSLDKLSDKLNQLNESTPTYFEELLDPRMLDELMMILLLIGTDYDGPENYRIKRVVNNKYVLECCGKSPVFCKFSRSVLFCLDQMQKPIHLDAINTMLQLQHDTFQDFFTSMVNSQIFLRYRFAEEIHLRLSSMKRILAQNAVITHMELMAQLDPTLFSVYEGAFEKADILSRYQHMSISNSAVPRKTSPITQQNDFQEFEVQHQLSEEIKTALAMGEVAAFTKLTFDSLKSHIINTIDFKAYQQNSPLFQAVTTILSKDVFKPVRINLSHCKITPEALERFLKLNGAELVYLNLDSCSEAVKPHILEKINKYCPQLKELILSNTRVFTIDSPLKVTHLDLSNTPITNASLGTIQKNCTELHTLILRNTKITNIFFPFNIKHLDLSGTKINSEIFIELKEKCIQLRYLCLKNCSDITEITPNNFDYLIRLDLSDCPNLTNIYSTKLDKLYANRCPKLGSIIIIDAAHLTELHANDCNLTNLKLSNGNSLPHLRVLMINNNRKLETLIANPVRLSRFTADKCHHIKSALGETFHQRLLDLVIQGNMNAFSALLNMRADAVHWAMLTRGQSVFINLNLQGLDARNADLEYANFEGCDFSNTNFSLAKLNNMNARRAIFTGAIFGQLSKVPNPSPEKMIITKSSHGILSATIEENGLFINITNSRTGAKIITFKAHELHVNSLKFTADGKFLVTSGYDHTIKLWNVSNWQCHKILKCHSKNVKCITTSHDNQLICSIDSATKEQNTLTVWRIKTGEPVQKLNVNVSISALEIEPTDPQRNMPTWIVKVYCDNNYIRRFIIIDDDSEPQLNSTEKSNQLSAKGMDITEATGLSEDNLTLLQQLGAVCDNYTKAYNK